MSADLDPTTRILVATAAKTKADTFYAPWQRLPTPTAPPPSVDDVYALVWPVTIASGTFTDAGVDQPTRDLTRAFITTDAGLAVGNWVESNPGADPNQAPAQPTVTPGLPPGVGVPPAGAQVPTWLKWTIGIGAVVVVGGVAIHLARG